MLAFTSSFFIPVESFPGSPSSCYYPWGWLELGELRSPSQRKNAGFHRLPCVLCSTYNGSQSWKNAEIALIGAGGMWVTNTSLPVGISANSGCKTRNLVACVWTHYWHEKHSVVCVCVLSWFTLFNRSPRTRQWEWNGEPIQPLLMSSWSLYGLLRDKTITTQINEIFSNKQLTCLWCIESKSTKPSFLSSVEVI